MSQEILPIPPSELRKAGNSPVSEPFLTIIVIVYGMSRQGRNTLISLATPYQRNVAQEDYEIIVVENDSEDELGREAAESAAPNIRYFYRHEPGVSPVPAVNFALDRARAPFIGLLIDGARMVTPRVIEYALLASRMNPHALVAAPGYHLGKIDQHLDPEHDEAKEIELLESVNWPEDGYKLFDIGCFSGANPTGFFHPMMECNCLFASRESFNRIGGADERFDRPGGGAVNLHLWRALGSLPDTQVVVLPGEGSFHQVHGGVTTEASRKNREQELVLIERQLAEIWHGLARSLEREPTLLGPVTEPAIRFLRTSARSGVDRWNRVRQFGYAEWRDDQERPPAFKKPSPHDK